MNEKSIMPLNSFSAYTPPFQYTAFADMQIHFSKLYQTRFTPHRQNSFNKEDSPGKSFSIDSTLVDFQRLSKKPVHQKEFIFGAEYDEISHNKSTLVSKLKQRKNLSLLETINKPQLEIPELLVSKSPTKLISRYISPYIRENRLTPKSVKEMRKPSKTKKRKLLAPVLNMDEALKIKEVCFDYFLKSLQVSNGIQLRVNEQKTYKFFVGLGNNSELVTKIIRTRPWWVKTDSYKEAHFVWTSTKHKKTLNKLPCGSKVELTKLQSNKKLTIKKILECEKQGYSLITKSKFFTSLSSQCIIDMSSIKLHNRLDCNKHLVSKKRLFFNLKKFYEQSGLEPFDYIPVTFHVKSLKDDSLDRFKLEFSRIEEKTREKLWIVKPGENTNRGKGIKVCNSISAIEEFISNNKEGRTFIIQKYIEKPLLIHKRKFDIRCFGLMTSFNNNIQGYFYPEGYIRTSCKEFSTKSFNKYIHLTNDAVQKNSEEYGKFEPGNKICYSEFQIYLNQDHPTLKKNFERDLNSQIRNIVSDTFKASYNIIDPTRKLHSFELLGYDFMIDENFKVWLIEVNTNPCLELSCGYLSKLIPSVLDNAFRLTLDQFFCPGIESKKFMKWIQDGVVANKFELVFSERNYRI